MTREDAVGVFRSGDVEITAYKTLSLSIYNRNVYRRGGVTVDGNELTPAERGHSYRVIPTGLLHESIIVYRATSRLRICDEETTSLLAEARAPIRNADPSLTVHPRVIDGSWMIDTGPCLSFEFFLHGPEEAARFCEVCARLEIPCDAKGTQPEYILGLLDDAEAALGVYRSLEEEVAAGITQAMEYPTVEKIDSALTQMATLEAVNVSLGSVLDELYSAMALYAAGFFSEAAMAQVAIRCEAVRSTRNATIKGKPHSAVVMTLTELRANLGLGEQGVSLNIRVIRAVLGLSPTTKKLSENMILSPDGDRLTITLADTVQVIVTKDQIQIYPSAGSSKEKVLSLLAGVDVSKSTASPLTEDRF